MKCVVCESEFEGDALYANAWERVRKRFPCCSQACTTRFDPDVHWRPAIWPAPASDEEEGRLLGVVHLRVKKGERPDVIAREMLQAGALDLVDAWDHARTVDPLG
jgi:hypothetical protein